MYTKTELYKMVKKATDKKIKNCKENMTQEEIKRLESLLPERADLLLVFLANIEQSVFENRLEIDVISMMEIKNIAIDNIKNENTIDVMKETKDLMEAVNKNVYKNGII